MFTYNRQSIGLSKLSSIIKSNPLFHTDLLMIQVAGTNGKGSTCHYLYSYLKDQTNKKVALFTSPHLYEVNERIELNGHTICDEELKELDQKLCTLFPKIEFGFFEKLCLIFILFCNKHKVQLAIVEVGLGGRLDPSNLISPNKLCLLSSISLDHQSTLGNTLEEIATEKLGICKNNKQIFLSNQLSYSVFIQQYCKEQNIDIIQAQQMSDFSNESQKNNAGLAKCTLEHLGYSNNVSKYLKHCKKVGRITPFTDQNLMDVCHNVESVEMLLDYIRLNSLMFETVYFNFLISKEYRKLIRMLQELCSRLILVELDDQRTLKRKHITNSEIKFIKKSDFLNKVPGFKNTLVLGCFPLVGELIQKLKL